MNHETLAPNAEVNQGQLSLYERFKSTDIQMGKLNAPLDTLVTFCPHYQKMRAEGLDHEAAIQSFEPEALEKFTHNVLVKGNVEVKEEWLQHSALKPQEPVPEKKSVETKQAEEPLKPVLVNTSPRETAIEPFVPEKFIRPESKEPPKLLMLSQEQEEILVLLPMAELPSQESVAEPQVVILPEAPIVEDFVTTSKLPVSKGEVVARLQLIEAKEVNKPEKIAVEDGETEKIEVLIIEQESPSIAPDLEEGFITDEDRDTEVRYIAEQPRIELFTELFAKTVIDADIAVVPLGEIAEPKQADSHETTLEPVQQSQEILEYLPLDMAADPELTQALEDLAQPEVEEIVEGLAEIETVALRLVDLVSTGQEDSMEASAIEAYLEVEIAFVLEKLGIQPHPEIVGAILNTVIAKAVANQSQKPQGQLVTFETKRDTTNFMRDAFQMLTQQLQLKKLARTAVRASTLQAA